MEEITPGAKIQSELQQGMSLAKCRQCGCMIDALQALHESPALRRKGPSDLPGNIEAWLKKLKPVRYT